MTLLWQCAAAAVPPIQCYSIQDKTNEARQFHQHFVYIVAHPEGGSRTRPKASLFISYLSARWMDVVCVCAYGVPPCTCIYTHALAHSHTIGRVDGKCLRSGSAAHRETKPVPCGVSAAALSSSYWPCTPKRPQYT